VGLDLLCEFSDLSLWARTPLARRRKPPPRSSDACGAAGGKG